MRTGVAADRGGARRRARLAGAWVAVGLALIWAATGAGDAAAAAPKVRILSPADDATATHAIVGVRVRATGPDFRAWLNGRDIRARFGRPRDGVRTARLRRGSDFRVGRLHLLVAVGKGRPRTDSVAFTALRRDDRLLSVTRLPARPRHAPLSLRARSTKRVERVQVRLNGRRVGHRLGRRSDGRGVEGRLGADDGLRFGRNRIVTRVVHADGTFARKVKVFRVSRRSALVGADADRRAVVGRRVVLDGTSTRRAQRGDRLRYRWRIVEAPRGGRPRLLHARSPRAQLIGRRPGVYRARLTVTTVRPRGVRRAAAAQAPDPLQPPKPVPVQPPKPVPLQPPGPEQLEPPGIRPLQPPAPAVDEVAISLGDAQTTMGLPVQTITKSGGIQIGAHPLYRPHGNWVRMLVLNPTNGAPKPGPWGTGNQSFDVDEGPALVTAIGKTSASELVVLTGQNISVPPGAIDAENLETAFETIGGTLASSGPTKGGGVDLASGQWSIIGHKGLAQGAAWQSFAVGQAGVPGFLGGDPGLPGTLNGWFQAVTNNAYQFVSPEFYALDTKASGSSATQNVIAVGDQRYPSTPIPAGALGAQLLLLDPAALSLVASETYVLNHPDGSTFEGTSSEFGVQRLAEQLSYWRQPVPGRRNQPPLLILQTFGSPKPGTAPLGSRFWINDALPSFAKSLDWYNDPYPNGKQRSQLLGMWNPGYPTVAGQVAELAGLQYHDVVANFGFRGRHMGGLTVVTGTQLYDPNASFVTGQTDPVPSVGRAVGTLSRNNQSQWALKAPSITDGWAEDQFPGAGEVDTTALWEMAFSAPTPWPATGGALAKANACIAAQIWGPDVTDVREAYQTKESDFVTDASQMTSGLADATFPPPPDSPAQQVCAAGFEASDFKTVKQQLTKEFPLVIKVRAGITAWQNVFSSASVDSYVNIQKAANDIVTEVLAAKASLPQKKAGLDAFGISADGLLVISTFAELAIATGQFEAIAFLPPAVGGISAGIALAGDLNEGDDAGGDTPPDPTGVIYAEASTLGASLVQHYDDISATLDHLGDVMVGDWGKLQVAGPRFNDQWAFGTNEKRAVRQSFGVAAKRSLYTAIMPLAFEQWVISPRWTNDNKHGVTYPASNYHCRWVTNDPLSGPDSWKLDGNDDPFKTPKAPAGASMTLTYRADTTAAPAQPRTSSVVGRGLKSSISRMNLQAWDNQLNVRHRGMDPPKNIGNLFEAVTPNDSPTDPVYLGMSQEEFFGNPAWTMRKMQCGHND